MSEFKTSDRLDFSSERRKHARAEVDAGVTMGFSGQEYVLVAKDISAGGLSTFPHSEIIESSLGTASFAIGGDQLPITCRCRVIYSADGRGVGVEFLDLSEESRHALQKFVDESN